jgi:hypothetical protein
MVDKLGRLIAFIMTFLLFALLLLSIPAFAHRGFWVWG